MKSLVFFAVCLAVAAAIRLDYLPGKRYTYEYETILAHGIPDVLAADMGVRVFAKAHFDYLKTNFVVMRLEGVVLETMKGQLLRADRIAKVVQEQTAQDDVKAKINEYLEMPVKFKFKGKTVEKEIIASAAEPKWSLNIKRALVNHFYLPIVDNDQLYQTREDEVTIAGKCKTAYTIVNNKPYFKVRRVIDLAQCTERPDVLQHNLPNVDKFLIKRQGRLTATTLPNFVRSAAYIDYDLQEVEPNKFIIGRVVSESEHDFTMLGDTYRAGKAVGARAKQTLKLIAKDQEIPANAIAIKNEQTRSGLMFVFDDGAGITFTTEAQNNIRAKVMTHIDELKQHLKEEVLKPEFAHSFTRLVSMLRRCGTTNLKAVVDKCIGETNIEVKKVLLDAIARIGTYDAVVLIKKEVKDAKMEDAFIARILFGLGWVRNLEVKVMNEVMDICKLVAGKPELQRTCWLSFGNLLNRLMMAFRTCPRLTQDMKMLKYRDLFAKTLIEGVTLNADHEVKITFIKAIGNAGFVTPKVLFTVIEHAKNPALPFHVRVQCVWALRHMARFKPILIRRALMPFFVNPTMDAELRIACYKILITSDPSLLTCQMIASAIAREVATCGPRSNQVVSFIASDLRASMNLDPFNAVMASRARLMLRFIPRNVVFGLFAYSKAIKLVVGTAKPAMEIHINKVNGRETFIPRHLGVKTKLHLPGISADFVEFGARIQGVHDILQPLFAPTTARSKRSIDVLNYIFGHVTHDEEVETGPVKPQAKLAPRFAAYLKLFGSEVHYGKLAKPDLVKIWKDALFGGGTATVGGITFTKTGITYKQPLTRAHLLTEACYIAPTLTGMPLKVSLKVAVAFKGKIKVDITGTPKLLTAKFDRIDAKVKVMPSVVFHMHNKIAVWLPPFETGIIVKNEIVTAPRIHANLMITKTAFTAEIPTVATDQKFLELRPKVHAVMRKELTPGVRKWIDIDLGMKMEGMVKIPKTCYLGERLGVAMCVEGTIVDRGYLRTKRLPAFPFYLLNNVNVVFVNKEDAPAKIITKHNIITNDAKTFYSTGATYFSGKTTKRQAEYKIHCDIAKWACAIEWYLVNPVCPSGCKAVTTYEKATANRIVIRHEQGEYRFDSEILFEKQATVMRIVNTWNKMSERIRQLVYHYHPDFIIFLHRYFAIDVAKKETKKCEIRLHLKNKYTADIFVDAPIHVLRRINQLLPVTLEKFPTSITEIEAMINSRYGTCVVKGNNYIKTTDNAIIKQLIPGTCPVCLARDARDPKKPAWQVLLKLTKEGKQNVIIKFKKIILVLTPYMEVLLNGNKVKVEDEMKLVGLLISRTAGKLFVQAEAGFQCVFDGTQTIVVLMPWWHNRVHGACGNNDGEMWTDLITPRQTFIPETLPREFIREWVMEGQTCQDKNCKLQAKRIQLTKGAPAHHVCFTNGLFLRCMADCKPLAQQTLKVAHHCLVEGNPLIARIQKGDKTVDLANYSIDFMAPAFEHLACQCTCH